MKKLITICMTDVLIIVLISTVSLADDIDITPPLPNPSLWAVAPYQYGLSSGYYNGEYYNNYYWHTMTAVLTSDISEPVQYYFELVAGGYGPHSSGWQLSNVYNYPVAFNPAQYGVYRVRAMDAVGNVTGWSELRSTLDAVPEPATLLLLGLGGLALLRKRRT